MILSTIKIYEKGCSSESHWYLENSRGNIEAEGALEE